MEKNEERVLAAGEFVSRSVSFKSGRLSPQTKKRRGGRVSGYLLTRLGVCAVLFCGLIGLKLAGGTVPDGLTDDGTAADERLGRLTFVDLPSIIDVFAPAKAAVLPVHALSFEALDEEGGIAIITVPGSDIVSPVAGRVKAVGEDETLGRYVSVVTDGDVEFTVYGLGETDVEQGQPVKQRQKLGSAKTATVAVRAYKSGRPVDLKELFPFEEAK